MCPCVDMCNNMLALNSSKTEVIRFSSKFIAGCGSRPCDIQVGSVSVHSSPVVCDLGVTLDASASMSSHVAVLSKSVNY